MKYYEDMIFNQQSPFLQVPFHHGLSVRSLLSTLPEHNPNSRTNIFNDKYSLNNNLTIAWIKNLGTN